MVPRLWVSGWLLFSVFDSFTGYPLAILDDQHYPSDIRTAAAGAVAARLLAPRDVDTVLVVAEGTQAYRQSRALHYERPFHRLRTWARNAGSAQAFAGRLESVLSMVDIDSVRNLPAAVQTADVVLTATQSRASLIQGTWLRSGQHLTAIGADDATKCELDATALRRSRVFVDEYATALATGDVQTVVPATTRRGPIVGIGLRRARFRRRSPSNRRCVAGSPAGRPSTPAPRQRCWPRPRG
jgi:ornithine cyclodeaminase/alanine dehydrogenase-like protein (mu-crystallin family)